MCMHVSYIICTHCRPLSLGLCVCVSYAFHWNLHKIIRERENDSNCPKKLLSPGSCCCAVAVRLCCCCCCACWPGLAWPIHQHTESTPEIPIPQSPNYPNAQTQFTFSVFASEVLKIDASGSLHMPQSNLLPPPHTLFGHAYRPLLFRFAVVCQQFWHIWFQNANASPTIVHSLQIRVTPGEVGSDTPHIHIYMCIYICHIYSCACRHARDFIFQMHIPLNCCKFVKVLMGQTFIALAIIMKRRKK